MADGATMQCRRCGFSNARGDQFCGSCGAFLEWQDEPATGGTDEGSSPVSSGPASSGPPAGGPDSAGSGPASATGPPSSAPPPAPAVAPGAAAPATGVPQPNAVPNAPSSGPTPPAEGRSAAPPPVAAEPAPDDNLVRCPACGIANPASRTFCQSCGTTLATASRVAEPSPDAIAAAVTSTPVTTAPVPPAGTHAGSAGRPAGRRIPGWFLLIALAGVLVGVGIVIVGPMIAGPGPGSAATTAPTAGVTAGPSGGAASVPAGSGGVSPAASDVKLVLTGATASSYLGGKARYQPENAIDGDLATSWQEGAATEKGQWIQVTFDPARADTLVIRNGYQASNALFKGNLRLKVVDVSVDGGSPIEARLKDTMKAQRIDLGGVAGATTVRITIVSTYRSQKTSTAGTPFDDAAVSEISVLGVTGG